MSLLLPKLSVSAISPQPTSTTARVLASTGALATATQPQPPTNLDAGTAATGRLHPSPELSPRNVTAENLENHACGKCGKPLYQFYINARAVVVMCSDRQCPYPFNLPKAEFLQHITPAAVPLDQIWGQDGNHKVFK